MLTEAEAPLLVWFFDRLVFPRYFLQGGATLRYPNGTERHYGPQPGGPRVRFASWRDLVHIIFNPSLAFGDAYTAGRITASPADLDQFTCIVARNRRQAGSLLRAFQWLYFRPLNFGWWQKIFISLHYGDAAPDDEGTPERESPLNSWTRWILGLFGLYTCARFITPEDSLDQAQQEKLDDIARKLGLTDQRHLPVSERQRALDLGCGWGGAACYFAQQFGIRVVAITLAGGQIAMAKARAREMGVDDLVEFIEISWQDFYAQARLRPDFQPFDVTYSIGLMEHVRHGDYKKFFRAVCYLTVRQGRVFVHCITNQRGGAPDQWIARRIFPASRLGTDWKILRASKKAGFFKMDAENLRDHYALTLRLWLDEHRRRHDDIIRVLGIEFYRERELWLSASIAAFIEGELSLDQFLFSNEAPKHGIWPLSRGVWYSHLRQPLA